MPDLNWRPARPPAREPIAGETVVLEPLDPDRHGADLFGFTVEGVFRQHRIVKGRNRDTAWYSITDVEWPSRRAAFDAWLAMANFDEQGAQRRSLADIRSGIHEAARG